MEIFFIIVICLAAVAGVVLCLYPISRKWVENMSSHTVENRDKNEKNHIYRVRMTKSELFKALSLVDVYGEVECSLSRDNSSVCFAKYHFDRVEYTLSVEERDGFCYILLERGELLFDNSAVPNSVDGFMVEKIGAEPLPYNKYIDMF